MRLLGLSLSQTAARQETLSPWPARGRARPRRRNRTQTPSAELVEMIRSNPARRRPHSPRPRFARRRAGLQPGARALGRELPDHRTDLVHHAGVVSELTRTGQGQHVLRDACSLSCADYGSKRAARTTMKTVGVSPSIRRSLTGQSPTRTSLSTATESDPLGHLIPRRVRIHTTPQDSTARVAAHRSTRSARPWQRPGIPGVDIATDIVRRYLPVPHNA